LTQLHRRARHRDHQHRSLFADDLIIEIDTNHGIGTKTARVLLDFGESFRTRIAHGVLIRPGAATDDVANAGKQIAEDVGADDDLADHQSEIFTDGTAFDDSGGGDDHGVLLGTVCRGRAYGTSKRNWKAGKRMERDGGVTPASRN